MKHIVSIAVFLFFSLAVMASGPVGRISEENIQKMNRTEHAERVKVLENRVLEIKNIPLSDLSSTEKKDLKSEVNYINKEMKMHRQSYGIYISGSALLIIILLIILL